MYLASRPSPRKPRDDLRIQFNMPEKTVVSDGKQLEEIIRYVEEALLPTGFTVEPRKLVRNEDGILIAELDLDIKGKVGSTIFTWLIECRDRPAEGPAPGAWIEQLVGRRTRFGHNKVTAVSTTGFSRGAVEFAQQQGIELRAVVELSAKHFADWLGMSQMSRIERRTVVQSATFLVDRDLPAELREAFEATMRTADQSRPPLYAVEHGQLVELKDAFSGAVSSVGALWDQIEAGAPPRQVRIRAIYPADDHFVVRTPDGDVTIRAIEFEGELSVHKTILPLSIATEYSGVEESVPISQNVAFEACTIGEGRFRLELHHLRETGDTHVVMRKVEAREKAQ